MIREKGKFWRSSHSRLFQSQAISHQ